MEIVAKDSLITPLSVQLTDPGSSSLKLKVGTVIQNNATQSAIPRQGLALATADFDEDGVPDLVAGFGDSAGAGGVNIQRGNVDAIYPNPALVYSIHENLEARLAGELIGNGFRTDANPGRSIVQYHVYRVGGNIAWQMRPGFKVTSGAGFEYERVVDYWRAGQLFRASNAPYVRLGIEISR